ESEAGPWTEVTNGGVIPGAEPGVDVTGKTVFVRIVLRTSDPKLTPRLQTIAWEVTQETDTDLINEGTAPADAVFMGRFPYQRIIFKSSISSRVDELCWIIPLR